MTLLAISRNLLLNRLRWNHKDGGDPKRRTVKRWNGGMAESRNGGKLPQILKDRIAESRNDGKYPQILKDGMTENAEILKDGIV